MSRPTDLTEEIYNRIVDSVRNGNSFKDACLLAGVAEKTGREWLGRGRETRCDRPSTPLYASFATDIKRAELEFKEEAIASIRKAAKGWKSTRIKTTQKDNGELDEQLIEETRYSWQAAAWLLERKYPHDFGTGSKRMDVLEALHTLSEAGWIPPELVEVAASEMGNVRERIQQAFQSAVTGQT